MSITKDPFELLKEDHDDLTLVLDRIEGTVVGDLSLRTKLVQQLKHEYLNHSCLEKAILYPYFKEREALRDTVIESENEHELINSLIDELTMIDPTEENWFTWFSVVRESIENHLSHEEGTIFELIAEELGPFELRQLGEQIKVYREGVKAA